MSRSEEFFWLAAREWAIENGIEDRGLMRLRIESDDGSRNSWVFDHAQKSRKYLDAEYASTFLAEALDGHESPETIRALVQSLLTSSPESELVLPDPNPFDLEHRASPNTRPPSANIEDAFRSIVEGTKIAKEDILADLASLLEGRLGPADPPSRSPAPGDDVGTSLGISDVPSGYTSTDISLSSGGSDE